MKKPIKLKWLKGRFWTIGIPYAWLLLFFALPFAIVLKLSFSTAAIAIPPYEATFQYADDVLNIFLHLGNYLMLLDDSLYYMAYLSSLKMALISTLGCLIIGYPMAYAIARAPARLQTVLLLLVM